MRLADYLRSRDESQVAFARRTGIPQATINGICNGAGTRSDTALRIIHATGGLVTLEDLIGDDRSPPGSGDPPEKREMPAAGSVAGTPEAA